MHWALLVAAGEEGSLEEFAELDDAASSRGGAAQPRHVCPLCVCVPVYKPRLPRLQQRGRLFPGASGLLSQACLDGH